MIEEPVSPAPRTERRLMEDLAAMGVDRGMTLMVHSSLSSIGWVVGGAPTVVRALLNAVGNNGTLAMPAATPLCADPATWPAPEVPEEWLEEFQENLPLFDLRTTPTSMGAIPETFRNWPGTQRSEHPLESVCAWGLAAAEITREHPMAFSEGRGGPFERLRDLDARILLVGVGFNRCTALHFAESLVANRRVAKVRFPILEEGRRIWLEVPNVADDNDTHFPIIGREFVRAGRAQRGHIGEARSTLFAMRDLAEVPGEPAADQAARQEAGRPASGDAEFQEACAGFLDLDTHVEDMREPSRGRIPDGQVAECPTPSLDPTQNPSDPPECDARVGMLNADSSSLGDRPFDDDLPMEMVQAGESLEIPQLSPRVLDAHRQ